MQSIVEGYSSFRACASRSVGALVTAAFATSLLVAPGTARAASSTGTVTGSVTAAGGGSPISGATVAARGQTATTDATGHFTLSSVATGTDTVTASDSAYKSSSSSVTVSKNATTTVNFSLAAKTGSIAGTVTDSGSGKAIVGVSVNVPGYSGTTTNSSGKYTFSTINVGSETLTASFTGYASSSQTVTVNSGAKTTANISLTKASSSSGAGSTITWNGSTSYLFGVNYPWQNYGTDFGTGGWGKYTNWTTINSDFATMSSQGVHVARWWVFSDCRYSPDFNADGTVSGLDSSVLSDVDQALQIAAANHIYLLLTVLDSSAWGSANTNGTVQMGGRAALVTDSATQQSYLDNALKPLLQHIAASPYANEVIGYDLVNEPEAQMSAFWGNSDLSTSAVQTFVQRCASYVHLYGGSAYATVGSAAPSYVSTWKGLGLDLYEIHYYPFADTANEPGSGLPTYASLNLDKPCIVGEYATVDNSYNTTDTAPQTAEWYLNTIYNYGYAGGIAWSYNSQDASTNWTSFQPLFTAWGQAHSSVVGPN